ncbi:hypothetical protein Fcan01_25849 [Folsomia candida]|uniref:Uncharacterized protein n=1 Tax=Folsomia candida TaxID=158441 RepID=A0A226D197_FOLCA|nr:hypothetical protein Fcan01_25849 [Folsomia candida]
MSGCFACGRISGSLSRPTYAKEIELFKTFVLDLGPSFKRKAELGDAVVAEFGASSHLCSTCLSSFLSHRGVADARKNRFNPERDILQYESSNTWRNWDSTNESSRPDSTSEGNPCKIVAPSFHDVVTDREDPEDETPINAIDPTRNHSKQVCCLKPSCNKSWHPDVPQHITLHSNITPEPQDGATSPPTWLPVRPNSRSCLSEEHAYSAPPRDEKLEKVQAELEDWKKNCRLLARKLERRNKTNAMLKEQIRE